MTVVKHQIVNRYRGGKTINIPSNSDSGLISINECRNLLSINSRYTMNEYLKLLGFFGQHFLNWDEVKEILKLRVFLGLKPGYNSKEMYLMLREQGFLQDIFTSYGIDIETRLRRIKDEYYKQQR